MKHPSLSAKKKKKLAHTIEHSMDIQLMTTSQMQEKHINTSLPGRKVCRGRGS